MLYQLSYARVRKWVYIKPAAASGKPEVARRDKILHLCCERRADSVCIYKTPPGDGCYKCSDKCSARRGWFRHRASTRTFRIVCTDADDGLATGFHHARADEPARSPERAVLHPAHVADEITQSLPAPRPRLGASLAQQRSEFINGLKLETQSLFQNPVAAEVTRLKLQETNLRQIKLFFAPQTAKIYPVNNPTQNPPGE